MTLCRGPHGDDRPDVGSDPLCRACVHRVRRALDELPGEYVELYAALTPGTTARVERKSKALSYVPLDTRAEALMRAVIEVLLAWEECVRADAGLVEQSVARRRAGRSDAVAVLRAAEVLDRHLPALLGLAAITHMRWTDDVFGSTDLDGVDGALEVLRVHGRVRAFLGRLHRGDRMIGVVCPCCHAAALVRTGESVACDACKAFWPLEDDYLAAVSAAATPLRPKETVS